MNSRTTSVAMTAAIEQDLLNLLVRDDGQEDLCLATYRPSTGETRPVRSSGRLSLLKTETGLFTATRP